MVTSKPMCNIGIPLKTSLRRYNLIDLDTNMAIACTHPIPDSALCDTCYGHMIKHAESIKLVETE
jgi:hypothetical protein